MFLSITATTKPGPYCQLCLTEVWEIFQIKKVGKKKLCLGKQNLPCSIISTKLRRWGRIAQPIRMAICCTILMPVCLACQDFLLLQTAFKKGNREGMPRADATTAKARAVVFLTYSSMLSISGRIVEIIVAKPAACSTKHKTHQLDLRTAHLIVPPCL